MKTNLKKISIFKKVSLIVFLALSTTAFSQVDRINYEAYTADKEKMDKTIDSLMDLMTLTEKLGQLNLPSSGDITTGQAQSSNVAQKIREGKIGGLFNIKSVEKIKNVQKIAVEDSRLGIPMIFGMDVVHGYETSFPIPLGLSTSWDMDLIEETAKMAAREATADGINWTFSPMVDLSRDARWGRVSEGAGEDPFYNSQVAKAMVRGYQQDDLSRNNTLMACVKHFALYGAAEAGRDYNTVDMSKNRMYNVYLPPYKAAVEAGVGSVMASFNEINGVPATGNKWLLTDVLREQWGFDGFVVTDYTGINEMVDHGIGDLQTVSARALNAGIDMDMVGEGFISTLEKSLEEGKVSMETINTAVRRVLEAKYQLGLFEDPYRYLDEERAAAEVFTKENRDFARQVASQSMVLLKNENNLLPLQKEGTIAVVGPLASNRTNMAGTWSVAAPQDKSVSVLEGIKEEVGNRAKIVYAKGSNVSYDLELEKRGTTFGKDIPRDGRSDEELRKEAIDIAAKADVIIAAIGESAEMSGESSSRTDISIPQAQKDLLQALLKTGKPVVLVLFNGRPLVMNEEDETVPAILDVWFGGTETGSAIADVLFGEVNPSAKLTMSFPRSVGQIPIFYNHKNTGRPLKNDKGEFEKFRSNYLDERNEPLYPFGYGLSYTTFEYSDLTLSSDKLSPEDTLEVSVTVKNSGNYDGKEVVQLYVRDLVGSITRPVKQLKCFQKVFIEKGESKKVIFSITAEDLKFYNNELEHVYEPGEFEVFVGTDSRNTLKSEFELIN
ncbi:beta-glucosidase [Salinimicrobium catena]|uniref:Periplasmic beta-glucosidase n=1 Tax=Salinimicrobium catena TaxID=390640 RepID=A0A1H5ISB4_9FLAO|nr:beta-glucosidase BglX [Salinimicrobium catena]SDK80171.1 beta-glucosidase [Salinimicrobium catena]SEE43102.1 beta-glucosidase [Salinimicrobium catena]